MHTKRAYAEMLVWMSLLVANVLAFIFVANAWPWRAFNIVAALISAGCVMLTARDLYKAGIARGLEQGYNACAYAYESALVAPAPWAPFLVTDDTEQES